MIDPAILSTIRRRLRLRRAVFVAALLATFAVLAFWVGGPDTVFLLAGMMAGLFCASPRVDPSLVMRLHRARPVAPFEAPGLFRTLRELSRRAGLRYPPQLYWQPSGGLNAFTTGTDGNAAVAISEGSLRLFNGRELAGVLAHEVSHIANGDSQLTLFSEIVRQMVTATGATGLILLAAVAVEAPSVDVPVWTPVLLLAGPALAFLIQRGLSRTSESIADVEAVVLTGDPYGLTSALHKIDRTTRTPLERLLGINRDDHPSTLLQTHPDIRERLKTLMDLAPVFRNPSAAMCSGHTVRFDTRRGLRQFLLDRS